MDDLKTFISDNVVRVGPDRISKQKTMADDVFSDPGIF